MQTGNKLALKKKKKGGKGRNAKSKFYSLGEATQLCLEDGF